MVAFLTSKATEVKSLEVVITPGLTTRKLKRNDFSWTHQNNDITGQTATLKSGETGTSREI